MCLCVCNSCPWVLISASVPSLRDSYESFLFETSIFTHGALLEMPWLPAEGHGSLVHQIFLNKHEHQDWPFLAHQLFPNHYCMNCQFISYYFHLCFLCIYCLNNYLKMLEIFLLSLSLYCIYVFKILVKQVTGNTSPITATPHCDSHTKITNIHIMNNHFILHFTHCKLTCIEQYCLALLYICYEVKW